MTCTPANASDNVTLVRLMIGDTDSTDLMFTDSEIGVVLGLQSIPTYAAAALADMAAAKFAREVRRRIGATSLDAQQKYDHFKDLAKCLREGGAGSLPGGDGTGQPTLGMFVGGTSKDANEARKNNEDEVQPNFSIGMDDAPGSVNDDDYWRRG